MDLCWWHDHLPDPIFWGLLRLLGLEADYRWLYEED